ncbi:unnamed protein product [Cyprideis torosa]|uniref:Uncharacterized protein n=1 Tax=Cyprideis torosa TaxID=163714 RepID=A0A7R8ZKU5_9CRUS|nr:unnamed protein product [Cyprideis torosa]CAG0885143.1 unnamed protein product [Cyprideis torosa]
MVDVAAGGCTGLRIALGSRLLALNRTLRKTFDFSRRIVPVVPMDEMKRGITEALKACDSRLSHHVTLDIIRGASDPKTIRTVAQACHIVLDDADPTTSTRPRNQIIYASQLLSRSKNDRKLYHCYLRRQPCVKSTFAIHRGRKTGVIHHPCMDGEMEWKEGEVAFLAKLALCSPPEWAKGDGGKAVIQGFRQSLFRALDREASGNCNAESVWRFRSLTFWKSVIGSTHPLKDFLLMSYFSMILTISHQLGVVSLALRVVAPLTWWVRGSPVDTGPIQMKPDVVKEAVMLHNFVRHHEGTRADPPQIPSCQSVALLAPLRGNLRRTAMDTREQSLLDVEDDEDVCDCDKDR